MHDFAFNFDILGLLVSENSYFNETSKLFELRLLIVLCLDFVLFISAEVLKLSIVLSHDSEDLFPR